MTEITTYQEMNNKIAELLRLSDEPIQLYAAQLIEELLAKKRHEVHCENVATDYADCDQFVCSKCGIELQN